MKSLDQNVKFQVSAFHLLVLAHIAKIIISKLTHVKQIIAWLRGSVPASDQGFPGSIPENEPRHTKDVKILPTVALLGT